MIIMANPSFTPFSVAVAFSKLKEASEVIRCCQVLLLKSAGPEGGKAWSFKEGSDFSCEDPFSTVESSLFTPEQSKFIGFDEVGTRHCICGTMPVASGSFLDVLNYEASMVSPDSATMAGGHELGEGFAGGEESVDVGGTRHDICFKMHVRSGRFLDVLNYEASMVSASFGSRP